MLGQPVSMLIPKVVGFKLTGEIPAGATATDLVLTITEMLRKHGVVGKFVEFYGEGVAAVPLANRATIGNMSPEFGSTCAIFPIDDETLPYLQLTGRAERAGRAGRGLRQGAGPVARPEPRADVLREPRARPVAPSCRRSPGRSGRRTGSRCTDAKAAFRTALRDYADDSRRTRARRGRLEEPSRPATRRAVSGQRRRHPGGVGRRRGARPAEPPTRSTSDGDGGRARPRRRRDRRHHLVHQHVQPVGDARRRAAGQEGRRAGPARKPWVKTSLAPGSQGRHRLLREGRAERRTWTSSASTWSATAAPPASATPARCPRSLGGGQRGRPRGGLGAVRQPQLRGPDQPRREDELPRVAAAGRRLRAGRHDGLRLRERAAGHRHRRQRRLPRATSGRSPEEIQDVIDSAISQEMFTKDYADVFAGDERWHVLPDPGPATPSSGTTTPPTCASPRTSRACSASRRRSADIAGARVLAMLGDSVTTDHISPAGSIKADSPGRQVPDRARRRARRTSTPTARAAATTR